MTEVRGSSLHGKLVSYALLRLEKENKCPAKLDKIYAWYETFASQVDADVVTSRTVHNTLNDLMMNGVVTAHEVNKGTERWSTLRLRAGGPAPARRRRTDRG